MNRVSVLLGVVATVVTLVAIAAFAIANEDCQEIISLLWRYGRYLDPEIAALLSDMEASAFSQMLRFIGDIPMGDGNLSALAGVYLPFFQRR
jgi:hypothetical protein